MANPNPHTEAQDFVIRAAEKATTGTGMTFAIRERIGEKDANGRVTQMIIFAVDAEGRPLYHEVEMAVYEDGVKIRTEPRVYPIECPYRSCGPCESRDITL